MNDCGYLLCTWPEFLMAYGLWAACCLLLAWTFCKSLEQTSALQDGVA